MFSAECFIFFSNDITATMGARGLIELNFPDSTFFAATSPTGFSELLAQKNRYCPICLIYYELQESEKINKYIKSVIHENTEASFIVFLDPNFLVNDAYDLKQSGARGIIIKTASSTTILHSIKEVLASRTFIQKEVQKILDTSPERNIEVKSEEILINQLSNRELEIVEMLLKGRRLLDISHDLSLSRSTVATFLSRAKKKLKTNNLIELIKRYRHLFIKD